MQPETVEKQRKEARDAAELSAARDRDATRALMDTLPGRRYLRRILRTSGITRQGFSGDALASAYHEGQRSIGLALLEDAKRNAPENYHLLWTETDE